LRLWVCVPNKLGSNPGCSTVMVGLVWESSGYCARFVASGRHIVQPGQCLIVTHLWTKSAGIHAVPQVASVRNNCCKNKPSKW
jgi:hypothetical protein